jgi:hypothetical protein
VRLKAAIFTFTKDDIRACDMILLGAMEYFTADDTYASDKILYEAIFLN